MAPYNRRTFLDVLGTFSATAFLTSLSRPAWSRNLDKALMHAEHRGPGELAGDEDFIISMFHDRVLYAGHSPWGTERSNS